MRFINDGGASSEYRSHLYQNDATPYFTVRIDFSNGAGTDYRYITNSASAQHPAGATVYDDILSGYNGESQGLDFLSGISSIGSLVVTIVDDDGSFNTEIKTMEAAGYSLSNAEMVVYEGYDDMAWDDYIVGKEGNIRSYTWQSGAYTIVAKGAEILLGKKIFQEKVTTLLYPINETDRFLQFGNITGWEPVEHSKHFSDGISYDTTGGSAYCTGNGTTKVTFTNVTVIGKASPGDRIDINGTDYTIDAITGDAELYTTSAVPAGTFDFQIYPKYIYVKIDDEKIRCPYGYIDFDNHTASEVVRGALGTVAERHSPSNDQLVRNGSFIKNARWTSSGGALSGWTIDTSLQKITHSTGNVSNLDQSIDIEDNKLYTVQFQMLDRTAGSVVVKLGGTSAGSFSTNQLNTVQVYSGSSSNTDLQFQPTTDFDGSLDNITVVLTKTGTSGLEVAQHVYLEMELVKLMKAVLVGALENQTGENIPSYWEAGLSASNLDVDSFSTIGTDIWDATNEDGIIAFFDGEKEQDCKKFIEQQCLINMYMVITGDNKLSLRRREKAYATAGGVMSFGPENCWGESSLKHDANNIFNRFSLLWDWSDSSERHRRETQFIDLAAIDRLNRITDFKVIEYRGLRGSNYTNEFVHQILENQHAMFSGSPSLIRAETFYIASLLEVGDSVMLSMESLQIDTPVTGGSTDWFDPDTGAWSSRQYQSFIVTKIKYDAWNQKVTMDLYGATGDPYVVDSTERGAVLDDSWYASHVETGTAQAGAATTITLAAGANATDDHYNYDSIYITGGTGSGQRKTVTDYNGTTKVATVDSAWSTNPDATSTYEVGAIDISTLTGYATSGGVGRLTSNLTLTGNDDGSYGSSIYFLDQPLVVLDGVMITATGNVRFYIPGQVSWNGVGDLSGGGDSGKTWSSGNQDNFANGYDESTSYYQLTTPMGYTSSVGGIYLYQPYPNLYARAGQPGHTGSPNKLTIPNAIPKASTTTSLSLSITDLRGVGGAAGGGVVIGQATPPDYTVSHTKTNGAGDGGDGGSGIMFVCRGFVFGINGSINTSGEDGSQATAVYNPGRGYDLMPGSGAGGAPGGLAIYLDGANATPPVFTATNHIARYGSTPQPPYSVSKLYNPNFEFVGIADSSDYAYAIPPNHGNNTDASQGMRIVKYITTNTQIFTEPEPAGPASISNLNISSGTDYLKTLPDGTVVSGALIDWDGSEDKDVYKYEVFWRKHTTVTTTNVSSITSANPPVITTDAAHGLSTGELALIRNTGMWQINHNIYPLRVTVLTTTTFSVDGVDASTFNAAGAGGTITTHVVQDPWHLGDTILAPDTDVLLYGMFADGEVYDFKVNAINLWQVASESVELTNQTIAGKGVSPSVPTSVTVRSDPIGARVEWVCPSDLDMNIYEIYMSSANTIPTNPTYRVAASKPSTNQYYTIPLYEGSHKYFWIKAVDTSGNSSSSVATTPTSYKRPLPYIINPTNTFKQSTSPIGTAGDIWHDTSTDTMYRNDPTTDPIEVATVVASDAGNLDEFATSIALSGNGTVMAVGAPKWDGGAGTDQGAVYLYDWNGSSWDERSTILTASDASLGDSFGSGVSLSGDGTTLVIGAALATVDAASTQGTVYIYNWDGETWTEESTTLTSSDGGTGDNFGHSVAISGDGTIIAVGAINWDGSGGTDQGAMYVFEREGEEWVERTTALEASDAGTIDYFGNACSLSADGSKMAVGAYLWDGGAGSGQGAVYIYDWDGSSWTEESTILTASDASANWQFGSGVALSNDGLTLFVGSSTAVDSGFTVGTVYVFDWNGSAWVERSTSLLSSDEEADARFGSSTAISSDGAVLAVGANNADEGSTQEGKAFVFNTQWKPTSDQTGAHVLETYSDDLTIDGDFERNDILYWNSGATVSKDTGTVKYGTNSLKITSTSLTEQTWYSGNKAFIPVESVDTFEWRFWANAASGTVALILTLYQDDQSTVVATKTLGAHSTSTWTLKSGTGQTIDANTRYMTVGFKMTSAGTAYVDAVFIKRE